MLERISAVGRRVLASLPDRVPQVLRRLQGRVLILAYHRVLPEGERRRQFVQPGMYVRDVVFEAHLRFLREHFRILSFPEFLVRRRTRSWDAGERYCVITFDDGWLDNFLHAYPLLQRHQATATIFLPTALIGSEEWLWPDRLAWLLTRSGLPPGVVRERLQPLAARHPWLARATRRSGAAHLDAAIEHCKALPDGMAADLLLEMAARLHVEVPKTRLFLEWRDVEEMSRGGITFGSHGATHRLLPRLPAGDLSAEVAGSLQALRSRPVNHVPVFCYPNGDHDDAVVRAVEAAGYEAAVSIGSDAARWDDADPLRLPRVSVHDDVSASVPLLAFHLARVVSR